MRAQTYRAVQQLLSQALDQPTARRLSWLENRLDVPTEIRRAVEELLVADASAERFLEIPAVESWLADLHAGQVELLPGVEIGPYRVTQSLGRGGMGVVVLAESQNDERRPPVAIKIADSQLDEESLARFRRERQILAELDHPHIARLLDGGSTPHGQPYLVMEYVAGEPIDRHAAALSVAECIRLVRQVLDAVAYAHQRWILHLDLKPANILVDAEGQPKLLDFGIAKLLRTQDEAALTVAPRPLTPAYASPEQRRGERLTTASDVYSLGRLLEVLLTGSEEDRVGAVDGTTSTANSRSGASNGRRKLASDLRVVLAKALAEAPEARYLTVGELDADLVRYLEDRPLSVRPPTLLYRSSRFYRRHRLKVSLAALLFVSSLSASLLISAQAQRLEQERRSADQATEDAEEIMVLLTDLLGDLEPGELDGTTLTVHQLLDRGISALERHDARPAVHARLLEIVGTAYRERGDLAAAEPLLVRAQVLRQRSTDEP